MCKQVVPLFLPRYVLIDRGRKDTSRRIFYSVIKREKQNRGLTINDRSID